VLQVIPRKVGAHEGLRGPFVIADFEDGLSLAWRDTAVFGQLVDLDFNPGFSLVAIDPGARNGLVIAEFHGFRSDVALARMHIELTPASRQWYGYWLEQFERIWCAARIPD